MKILLWVKYMLDNSTVESYTFQIKFCQIIKIKDAIHMMIMKEPEYMFKTNTYTLIRN